MTMVVQIRGVSKTYASRGKICCKALNNLNLDVTDGEMLALIGPSGSGKSTLLRQIAGLSDGDLRQGSALHVLEQPMQLDGRITRCARKTRSRVGFVFQQFNLVGRLTVLSNVLIGTLGRLPAWRGNLGLFSRDDRLCAMAALDRVGLADLALQRASTLSGGQQQRVAIARALAQRATLILADEPIASLDPESSRRVMELLRALNRDDGKTVVVSLHQVEYALGYCDRVVALKHGEICLDQPAKALDAGKLDAIYRDARPAPTSRRRHKPTPIGESIKAVG